MTSGASAVGLTIATGGAGQAIGSAVGPAVEAGKGVYDCLKRKYDYIKNLKENFENFTTEEKYLIARAKDVERKIADNEVTHEPKHECNTWREHVKEEMEKVEKLKNRYEKAVNGSCAPCSLRTRLKLSKDLEKMTRTIKNLYNKIDPNFGVLVERRQNQLPRKSQMNIVQVRSLRQQVERLLEYVKDRSIKKIGIWGLFGVGKTTILESLKEEVEKLRLFDVVLQVAVPKESYDLCKMQREILKDLGVQTEHQNQAENLISSTLEGKKYLLLLDDVSSYSVKENHFKLCDIGFRDSHEHCKVVLATREREICKSMGTDEEIRVDKLSREDARKLFFDTVGEQFDRPYFKRMAERVLKQCGDLPQVVRAVGNHLKDKHSEQSWRSMLLTLQSPIMFTLGHLGEVYSAFTTIYEKLDDHSKNCLLYTASFPDDHEIYRDYLIECWKIEQLIGLHKTFRQARDEGYRSLETFIDGFLFDSGRSSKYVKMPIIFRNAARKVADANNFALRVKESGDRDEFPPVESWSNAKVLSLMNSELAKLPHEPMPMPVCSVLSTLFLQKNKKLSEIPLSFFGRMSSLKLLDLSGTGINSLPPSISNLTSLKGLYLNDCYELVHLPEEMKQLQNLELLDVRHSRVLGCHDVVAGQSHLRCLRAEYKSVIGNQNCVKTNGPVTTPSNTIEQLGKLEELTIDADPRDIEWNKIALKVAEQVAMLQKLSILSFYFPSTESLEVFTRNSFPWKRDISQPGDNFTSFNFYVYSEETHKSPTVDVSKCSGERYLFYSDGKDIPDVIKEVLSRTRAFELIAHQSIQDVSELGFERMEDLEICRVEGCNTMIAFLGSQVPLTPVFQCLKELYLCQLQHLNAICQGPVPLDSFARLRTLAVDDCPNLTELLSWKMAKQLLNLKHLKVKNCPRVKEIVATDSQSGDAGKFHKLKILELEKLGGLNSIHSNDTFKWPELQKVKIDRCDNLFNLFLSTTNASKLKRIECRRGWWQQLKDDKANLECFCYFTD